MAPESLAKYAASTIGATVVPVVVPAVTLATLDWRSVAVAVVVAAFAGVARGLNQSVEEEKYSHRHWIRDFFVGAVCGIVMWGVGTSQEWDVPKKLAAIAFAGWAGGYALDNIPRLWLKILKVLQ